MQRKKKKSYKPEVQTSIDINFSPNGLAQQQFFESEDDIATFIGGLGSGKTYVGAFKATHTFFKNPTADGFIGANSFDQLTNGTLKTLLEIWDNFKIPYSYNKQSKILQVDLPGFTGKIYCRTLSEAHLLRSYQFLWAWMDETRDTSKDAFDTLRGRLRQKVDNRDGKVLPPDIDAETMLEYKKKDLLVKNQLFITTTPDMLKCKWLYTFLRDPEYLKKRIQTGESVLEVHMSSRDNVFNQDSYVTTLESQYSDIYAKQEIEGEWVIIPDGAAVYSRYFTSKSHLDNFSYNPYMPLILGIDFGFHNPACLFAQEDTEGRLLILREYQGKDRTAKDFISDILDQISRHYPESLTELEIYCDIAGSHVQSQSGETDIDVLRRMTDTIPYYKKMDIDDTIELVRERLSNMINGRPKLLFDKRHTLLTQEALLGGYHYAISRGGVISTAPYKDNYYDHLMDCLRYIIANKYSRTSDQIMGLRRKGWKQKKTHNLIKYRTNY